MSIPEEQQEQDPRHFRLNLGFSHHHLAPLLACGVVETCLSQAQEETANLKLTATIPLLSHILVIPMCAVSRE